jgi:hypothetical protein
MSPLADTHAHLKSTHAGLAAQIQSLTDQTAQIRDTVHTQRSPSAAEHSATHQRRGSTG